MQTPGDVVTVKVARLLPAATVTASGTVAAALLLLSATTDPPVGAAVVSVTVPVELLPPVTLVGLKLKVLRAVEVIVNTAVRVTPPKLAVIVTAVDVDTGDVVTVKVALLLPAATVTAAGTVAAPLSLLSDTADPPAGAGPLSVTVPVELTPPLTLVGLKLRVTKAGGITVSVVVWLPPP